MADILKEIADKIGYAKSLHTEAHARMAEWESVYKSDYTVTRGVFDSSTQHDSESVYRPSEPRAIINKYLATFNLQETIQVQVLPTKETDAEERVCTRLEQFLQGYQRRVQIEARKPVFRHAVWHALVRGKMILCAQYVPEFVNTDRFPIRSTAPDPLTVYEVLSDAGVLYFIREYKRYALDLRAELSRKRRSASGWADLQRNYADTDQLTVTEYWDGEYYACQVAETDPHKAQMLMPPTEHRYGFCPIAIAHIEDTPLDAVEDQFASPLAPISDALKEDAAFINTLRQAVDKFFFPLGVYTAADGKPVIFDPYAKGDLQPISPGTEIKWYSPTANVPILERYLARLREHVNKFTFPEISFAEGGQGESGYARAQVLSQVKDRVDDKVRNLNMAFGWHFGQVLSLAEQFKGNTEDGNWQVATVEPVRSKAGGAQQRLVTLKPTDIAGHTSVLCHITPEMPSDRMMTIQEINALRNRDPVSRRPVVDDKTLREMHPEIFEHPDEINQRIDEELYEREIPEIHEWNKTEFYKQWRAEHPVQSEAQGDLGKLKKDDLIALLQMAAMIIKNPQAAEQAMRAAGAPAEAMQPQGVLPPEAGAGGMMPSNILPPVMQGAPAQPNENELMLQQAGRAFNPPRP